MIYNITVSERLSRTVCINAASAKEAIDQAKADYRNCRLVLDATDYVPPTEFQLQK